MKFSPIITTGEPAPDELRAMAAEACDRAARLALDCVILQGRALPGARAPMSGPVRELAAEATAFATLTVAMAERIAALEARAAA